MQSNVSRNHYLVVLATFKFAVGAILLLVGWESLQLEDHKILTISIATLLSFTPAAFAKPLFQKFFLGNDAKKFDGPYRRATLSVMFGIAMMIAASLPFLKEVSPIGLGVLYFSLWILFFMIEASLEHWFISLAADLTQEDAKKLSSLSTAIMQVAVILGPLLIALIKELSNSKSISFFTIAIILGYGAFANFIATLPTTKSVDHSDEKSKSEMIQESTTKGEWINILALASIWPTIAIFNMVIPIIASKHLEHGIGIAATLEFIFGGAMAIIGFTLPVISSHMNQKFIRAIVVLATIISATTFAFGFRAEVIILLASALLGICYGYARIEIRAALARNFNAAKASNIVATANAISAPMVLACVLLTYLEFSPANSFLGEIVSLSLPIVFGVSMALLLICARQPQYQRSLGSTK